MRYLTAAGLALVAVIAAVGLGNRARLWNDELALRSPLAGEPPHVADPGTPRLAGRVVLIVVDGLGAGESRLPFLDELRGRGAGVVAHVPYPTISRPNYVTILTGVPPRDSGVRANRVVAPVAVDTVMDRVRAAGLRVATASNFGMMSSLFLRNTPSINNVRYVENGDRLAPAPPITWPVDEARRVGSLAELGHAIAELAARDAAFVPVLVLDVDRAGHAAGVGDDYRGAAQAVDRMLRAAFAGIDLSRDAVIVTADHGHVAPGGHGGAEPEVSSVPLVLAGKGIARGATARDPQLVDVAPTVAALLGVPAPGHAEGRTLVELLALDPADAARRTAADAERARAMAAVIDAAHAGQARPDALRLVLTAAGVALALALGVLLGRRGALAVALPGALAGCVALAVLSIAIAAATRGRVSPSYVPSFARLIEIGAVAVVVAVALQVAATARVARRARDRLAAVNGLALVGLTVALATVGLVRAWYAAPHLDVPPPFWMVAVPTLDLAAATCGLATAISLAVAAVHDVRRRAA